MTIRDALHGGLHRIDGTQLARGLGWFSIGLGLIQVAVPRRLGRGIGLRGDGRDQMVLRAIGARELLAGAAILTRSRPAMPMWARVGGDAMDLAMLGVPLATGRVDRTRGVAATAAVLGVTALDVLSGVRLQQRRAAARRRMQGTQGTSTRTQGSRAARMTATKKITVNRSQNEVTHFWQQAQSTPDFVPHLTERAHAVSFAPAPHGRGTEITVRLTGESGGEAGGAVKAARDAIGKTVARLTGHAPAQQLDRDLRVFKQVLETGELTRSEATAHGHPHPAIPLANNDAAKAQAAQGGVPDARAATPATAASV